MTFNHDILVAFAKSYGLIYMMVFFFLATIYACWPSNKEKFNRAANSVLLDNEENG